VNGRADIMIDSEEESKEYAIISCRKNSIAMKECKRMKPRWMGDEVLQLGSLTSVEIGNLERLGNHHPTFHFNSTRYYFKRHKLEEIIAARRLQCFYCS
jgi:hypothetical protein